MKRLLLIALLWLTACAPEGASLDAYSEVCYTPRYAQGFSICRTEQGTSTLLTTASPWQGAAAPSHLFIRRNNEPLPAHFTGQVIEGEVKRIVCMSSSYIAMLDRLGAVERVVGVSGIDFVSNSYIQQHHTEIGDVGYDGNLNYELLVALDPDIVLLYGVSGASEMENRLRELKIPFVYVGEYLEQHPLGKAEWMVFLAELLGTRTRAEALFAPIAERYEALTNLAGSASRPRVMFNSPYRDTWFMPPEGSYMIRLLNDAGGEYVFTDDGDNRSDVIDLEQAYLLLAEADLWLNPGTMQSLEELCRRFPRLADVEVVKAGRVYNNNARMNPHGGNDFWEQGVVEPDVALSDLIRILHPDLLPDHQLVYHHLLD